MTFAPVFNRVEDRPRASPPGNMYFPVPDYVAGLVGHSEPDQVNHLTRMGLWLVLDHSCSVKLLPLVNGRYGIIENAGSEARLGRVPVLNGNWDGFS
jgi:hypothetical protein